MNQEINYLFFKSMKCLSLRLRLIIIKKKKPFSKLFTFTKTWENAIQTLYGKCYMGSFLFFLCSPQYFPLHFLPAIHIGAVLKDHTGGQSAERKRESERRTAHPVLHEG